LPPLLNQLETRARQDGEREFEAYFNPMFSRSAQKEGDNLAQSRRVGAAVWAEMERHGVAPTPRVYELWFAYRSGVNPELTQRLAGLLERNDTLTTAVLDALHGEFVAGVDATIDALDEGAGDIQHVAQTLADQVAGGQAAIAGYGNTLAQWAQHLGNEPSVGGLVGAISALTKETTRAAERNRVLEQQLSTSAARIFRLRQSLAEVKQEATTDTLTGIANRRAFQARLKRTLIQARTEPSSVTSVLLLDIDHFKQFNDSYGHSTGDLVLRLVARLLTDNSKGRDLVARYGGEEFAILLSGADLKAAAAVAQQICDALSNKRLVFKGSQQAVGHVTVSIGVAQHRAGEGLATLIERADAALYRAKDFGRNRVCTADEDLLASLT